MRSLPVTKQHVGRRLRCVGLGVLLLWGSEASAVESGGFRLETGSPDALCPELEATREIVARRLGSLTVEGRKNWLARYTIGHAPAGNPRDFVRLELFNPEGEVELRRDLPIEGDSCRTMSEVIALVLDRYFRGLMATSESPPGAADTERPERASSVSVSVSEGAQAPRPHVRARERVPARAAELAVAAPVGRLSAEYAATLGQPYFGLRGSARLGLRLEAALALRFGLSALSESEPGAARVEASTVLSRASLAWKLALPPGFLHFGPAVSLALQRATTRGLSVDSARTRALWLAGVEAGFVAPLSRHLFVEGSAALDFSLPGASGQFLVDNREVLSPPARMVGWALGFGYAW